MSVIQTIRDRGAWIMLALIALALIAFILQDGLGRKGGGSSSTTLGVVNGVKIDKEEFDAKLALYSRGGQSRENIMPQLWNQEVQTILMQQEYDKLGLTVSSKELADYLYSPQSPLAKERGFQDDNGQFDVAKAQQWMASLKKSKKDEETRPVMEQLIEPTIQQLLATKYQTLVRQSAYVPTWLIEKQKAENAAIASISYVYVPYSSITDTTIKASDDEIMAYVKKHPKNFEKDEETRTFSYVSFDAAASAADSAAALNNVLALKEEFAASTDAKSFLAKAGTERPYSNSYEIKSKLKSVKADTIKTLAIGQSYGPYIDGNNYVIAKVIGTKTIPDSVFCSHILVRTGEGGLSDSLASKRMDSVIAAIKAGADFNTVMQQVSDDKVATKENGGVMKFDAAQIQAENFDEDFAKYILFEGKQGESKMVKTKFGYHYIKIVEQKNFDVAMNVAYLAKAITVSNETIGSANTAALKFAAGVKNRSQFEESAKKANLPVLQSQEVRESDFSIPIFGQSPSRPIVRWLYENDLGTISEPTDVGDKYIVSIITGVSKKGLVSANEARPRVAGIVINEKKAKQIIETKFKGSSLESYAASAGVAIQRLDSLSLTNPSMPPPIGYEPKVLGSSFNKELQGKVSSPIAGNNGVVALKVEMIGAKAVAMDNESIKQNLLQQAQRNAGSGGIEALKKTATIKDNRMKMLY